MEKTKIIKKIEVDLDTEYKDSILYYLDTIGETLKGIRLLFFIYLLGLFISFVIHTVLPIVGFFSVLNGINSINTTNNTLHLPKR